MIFIAATFSLKADIDIDPQNIGSEKITQPAKQSPFSFNVHGDYVHDGRIGSGSYKKDKVDYGEIFAEAGMVAYYDPILTEGARVALSYTGTYLKWHDNPWFQQDRFSTFSVTVSAFTKRLNQWFWRTQLSANFDTENWSSKYTSYDLLLWGRYTLFEDIGIHFGFMAETGLRLDRIYPILGFDWQISKRWKLNAVFPVNMALLYSFSSNWSAGISGRIFNSRFRVNHNEYALKPLVRYTNLGAEFIVKYETGNVSANFHVGSTLWGKYRVADHCNNHARSYDLNPAGYAGLEVDMTF